MELISYNTKIESWGDNMFEKKKNWEKEKEIIGIDVSKDGYWLAI